MIGKLKPGKLADWRKGLEDWKSARNVPGFVNEYTLIGNDGVTLASCVVFESKEAYMDLANDPDQDHWWRTRVVPLLDGEVSWIDGTWAD
jgi:hypothetical protein